MKIEFETSELVDGLWDACPDVVNQDTGEPMPPEWIAEQQFLAWVKQNADLTTNNEDEDGEGEE